MGSNVVSVCFDPNFLQNISFCVVKVIQVSNDMSHHVWVIYPFKIHAIFVSENVIV